MGHGVVLPPEDDGRPRARPRGEARELHPYDTPEIVAVAIVDGDPDYLRWIVESVGDPVAP